MAAPQVDVNIIVYNGEKYIDETMERVRAQTHENLAITVFDNCSTDSTPRLLEKHREKDRRVAVRRNTFNVGTARNYQMMLWGGQSEFILPKTADDLISEDYVERLLEKMVADDRMALVYAKSKVIDDDGEVTEVYADTHLFRTDPSDPLKAAIEVMSRFTFAPPFWGLYRKSMLDLVRPLVHQHGVDHFMMAELSLYGRIDYVDDYLFFRRGGAGEVEKNAEAGTEEKNRGLPLNTAFSQFNHLTPFITMCYGHMEMFAKARVDVSIKGALCEAARIVMTDRFGNRMNNEVLLHEKNIKQVIRSIESGGWPKLPFDESYLLRTLLKEMECMLLVMPNQPTLMRTRETLSEFADRRAILRSGETVLARRR